MTKAEVEVPRRAVVRLVRFGFEDGERAARLLSDPALGLWDLERNEPADPEAGPVVAALARAGDPDLAAPLAAPAGRGAGPPTPAAVAAAACWPGCGARACCAAGCWRSWAPSSGLADHLAAHPGDWTVLDAEGDGIDRGRPARRPTSWNARCWPPSAPTPTTRPGACGWARARPTPRRSGSPRCAWPTAAAILSLAGRDLGDGLPAEEVAAELADIAAAVLTAGLALAVAEQPAGRRACRLAVIAWASAAGGSSTTSATSTSSSWPSRSTRPTPRARPDQRHPRRGRADADLPRGGLGGRRRAAPGGQGRRAGAHRRRARGLLRAVGQHLGVPGAAEDAAGRRRPRPRPGLRRRALAAGVDAGDRPDFVGEVQAMRRGWRPTSRPRRPSGSSSSAAAGCATSSSPSSCCRWCTAGPTSRCGSAARCRRSGRCRPAATSAGRTPPR